MDNIHGNKNFSYIDKRITAIQKSTATKNPRFQKLNEFFRHRFGWYYDFRINPRYAGKDLDDQILRIQKSTKTRIRQLQPAHDHLRQKYDWYYAWHLRPFSNSFHVATVVVYTCSVFIFCMYFVVSSHPGVSSAKYTDSKTDLQKSSTIENSSDKNKAEKTKEKEEPQVLETAKKTNNVEQKEINVENSASTPNSQEIAIENEPAEPGIIEPENSPAVSQESVEGNTIETTTSATGTQSEEIARQDNNQSSDVINSNSSETNAVSPPSEIPQDSVTSDIPESAKKVDQTPKQPVAKTIGNSILLQPTILQSNEGPNSFQPVNTANPQSPTKEIRYGTSKEHLNLSFVVPPSSTPQTVNLPNLKSRTYYYQVVETDKNGDKQSSEVNVLKNGNPLIRFISDGWNWLRSKIIEQTSSTISF